jgi:hypothetical protein
VLDPSGAPVQGTVLVTLQRPSGDFFTVMQTTADAQGRFTFKNVPSFQSNGTLTGYAIVVAARSDHDPGTAPGTPGSFFTPALLLSGGGTFGPGDPIVPGTNVGTITLHFSSQGDVEGTITSTNSTGTTPVPIKAKLTSLRFFSNDFVFDYPFIGQLPQVTTQAGPTCPTGTACAAFTMDRVPTDVVEEAVFSKAGYAFTPGPNGPNFELLWNAFSLLNGKADCNPNNITLFANDLKGDSPNNAGTAAFTSCQ